MCPPAASDIGLVRATPMHCVCCMLHLGYVAFSVQKIWMKNAPIGLLLKGKLCNILEIFFKQPWLYDHIVSCPTTEKQETT